MNSLREDLDLIGPASRDEEGNAWVLHDSVNNRFFKLGTAEVKILSLIRHMKMDFQRLETISRDVALRLDDVFSADYVESFLLFLKQNNLLTANGLESRASLLKQRQQLQPGLFKKVLRNYLFMRFHVINPNKLLDRMLPFLSWAFHPIFWLLILGNGLAGIYLTSRQFDAFTSSFLGYLNLQGLFAAGIAIALVKVMHEFGHALVARKFGCAVNSMGFALLVFWPVLYTDTTDAWRLQDARKRALIGASGVLVELVVASFCLTLWHLTDAGLLRSVLFILATTTWFLTLLINLNPLLRFDGYYVLSDLWGVENLQSRSFALARWQLREWMFGYGDPAPENPRRSLVLFAFATWTYRFLLYLGISLIIYSYFFKLLGLFLLIMHTSNALLKPLSVEVKHWWEQRGKARLYPNSLISLLLFAALLLWLLIPAKRELHLSAIYQGVDTLPIYVREPGRLQSFIEFDGQAVNAGDTLVEMQFPDMQYQLNQLQLDQALIEAQLSGQGVNSNRAVPRAALLAQLRSNRQQVDELAQKLANGRILAPFDGIVRSINQDLSQGQWLSRGERLMTLIQPAQQEILAYISEQDVSRISTGQTALFYTDGGSNPPVALTLIETENYPMQSLDQLYAASSFGGKLQVRNGNEGELIPQDSSYRLHFQPEATTFDRILRGTVAISTEASSPLIRLWRNGVSVWRRESGF